MLNENLQMIASSDCQCRLEFIKMYSGRLKEKMDISDLGQYVNNESMMKVPGILDEPILSIDRIYLDTVAIPTERNDWKPKQQSLPLGYLSLKDITQAHAMCNHTKKIK